MRFIRQEDKSEETQELLFSRLQQVIPPHRKNDPIPEEEMVGSENGNEDKEDDDEDDTTPNNSDFQTRLRAALSAARAFHRCSFE